MNTDTNDATPASSSAAVLGPQFVVPYPVDLFFTTKAPGMKKGILVAFDVNGQLVFQVHPKRGRIVSDAAGNPLISIKDKFRSFHNRKQMFRGNSKENKDLLFSVKDSTWFQLHEKKDVFLAHNTNEEVCDYKITGNFRKRSVIVNKGDSSLVVAQMSKAGDTNLQLGKHGFRVSVSPNTDFAFIASLFFLLHQLEIERSTAAASSAGAAASSAGAAARSAGAASASAAAAASASAGGGC